MKKCSVIGMCSDQTAERIIMIPLISNSSLKKFYSKQPNIGLTQESMHRERGSFRNN